ncbi:MAG: stage II sporulation protein P, partial [Clostridia bacterium]
MSISLIILTIIIFIIMFGMADRFLDKMRMNDISALILCIAIVIGIIIPPIYITEYFAFSIGGFLIPFGICIYLLIKCGWSRDLLRSVIGTILIAGIVLGLEYLLPAEPEKLVIEPVFIYGIITGIVAYIMGRSRRNAFISAVFGITLAKLIQWIINWSTGIKTVLGLGVAGAFDMIIVASLISLALCEFIGRVYSRIKPDKFAKKYNFETGSYDSVKNGKISKTEQETTKTEQENSDKHVEKNRTIKTEQETTKTKSKPNKKRVGKTKKVMTCFALIFAFAFMVSSFNTAFSPFAHALDTDNKYYTIYDSQNSGKVLFVRGESVFNGDEYISNENILYELYDVDNTNKTAKAKFKANVKMPVYNVKKNNNSSKKVNALSKTVGMYHTHNDECYIPTDGVDSVYGNGGVTDVGKSFKANLEALGISVKYSDALHLPHNSGAYGRSEVTASKLIRENKLNAIFDVHRDSTPRSEYVTSVNGVKMSKVRMVIGSANQNSSINKEFALSIKSYADEVYPNLIKDIYIGKGSYNQQLSPRAMLFEMGCENIEKNLVQNSTIPLSKTLDMVLFGSDSASKTTLSDVSATGGETLQVTGLINQSSVAPLDTLWVVLGTIAGVLLMFSIVLIFDRETRFKTKRFFAEIFPFTKKT